jgi:hypothetical protein
VIVPPDDLDAIRDAIWTLYRRSKEGNLALSVNNQAIRRYTWNRLTVELASVFDEVLAAHFRNGAVEVLDGEQSPFANRIEP